MIKPELKDSAVVVEEVTASLQQRGVGKHLVEVIACCLYISNIVITILKVSLLVED